MGKYLGSEISLPLFLIIVFFKVSIASHQEDECYSKKANCGGPEIRFPFWLKNNETNQTNGCGYPGFGLSCSAGGKTLTLTYPALPVDLFVGSIDYVSQSIHVYAGDDDCPYNRRLQDLDLSASPFQFDSPYVYDYTFFNCSPSPDRDGSKLFPYPSIPCLSSSSVHGGYKVYAISTSIDLQRLPLTNCQKTAVTLSQVPYDVFRPPSKLVLKWFIPNCGKCEAGGQRCRLKDSAGSVVDCYGTLNPGEGKGAMEKLKTAGYVLCPFLVTLLAIGCYHIYSADKTEKENRAKIEKFLDDYNARKATRYSYADIKRVTNQFKDKLGQGGYGTVFKGKLSSEIFVAVKILNSTKGNGEEFINEVGTMGTIHHVNVVRLVGFCADGFRRALVYEFLANESLEKFIFSDSIKKALGWKKLKEIALGIAKGIEYLHQGCDQRILHFDIKPHNILLDHNFNPKISDFGLAKLCSKEQSAISMTAARGTIGYIAPEVFSRNFGSVSYKSDVYSFGMLLLDMVEGRRKIDVPVESSSQGYFPDWIYNQLERGEVVGTAIDTVGDATVAKQLTIVGLWCIQWYPIDRPSMKGVVEMLEGDGECLTMPPNPFTSTNPTTTSTAKTGRDLRTELATISESE